MTVDVIITGSLILLALALVMRERRRRDRQLRATGRHYTAMDEFASPSARVIQFPSGGRERHFDRVDGRRGRS